MIRINVVNPIPIVTFKKIVKSNFQDISNIFSIIKWDAIDAKNKEIIMIEKKNN